MPNPLLAGPAATPQQPQAQPQAAPQQPGPTLGGNAAALQQMNFTPAQAAQKADGAQFLLHALAPLARGKGDVTIRDVAKVAAGMVSEGHSSVADAVKMLTNLPNDPKELKTVIQGLFKGSILSAINLAPAKQAMMGAPGAATQPPPPAEVQAAQQATPAPTGVV